MSWDYTLDRRIGLLAIAVFALFPVLCSSGQPPIVNIQTDYTADNEALYVAKNVLCFVRGKKSVKSVEVLDIQHTDAGSNRASVVRLRYGTKRSKINAVVTMEMVKKPGLRRIYQLTFRDDVSQLYLPEQLLEVREQINTVFARGDLLTRLTPHQIPFETLPLVEESMR